MYKYMEVAKHFNERRVIRQTKAITILLTIPISFWLVPRKPFLFYLLLILGVLLALNELNLRVPCHKEERALYTSFKMAALNIYLIALVLFSGITQSPLGFLLILPVLFTAFGDRQWSALLNGLPLLALCLANLLLYFVHREPVNYFLVELLFLAGLFLFVQQTFLQINKHFNEKILRLVIRDDLTSLYNRRFFKTQVLEMIRRRKPFALIILDINYFKYYNDQWGHPRGDALLNIFSQVLKEVAAPTDLVIRYSGDEFIIVIPDGTQARINQTVKHLYTVLDEYHFPGEECFPNQKLAISYGSVLSKGGLTTYQEILNSADQDLIKQKSRQKQRA